MNNRTPGKTERAAPRATSERRSGRRRMWFGPGTVLALLIAATVIGSGRLNGQARAIQDAGRVVYEADSHGRMQRVSAPSEAPAPSPVKPLWKPEVGPLLRGSRDLGLTTEQQKRLTKLNDAWLIEKASLEAALNDISRQVTGAAPSDGTHGMSLRAIQAGMGDYSGLSRDYDGRRAFYWMKAVEALSAKQRVQVDKWAAAGSLGRVQ
jgi:hypothetical protein